MMVSICIWVRAFCCVMAKLCCLVSRKEAKLRLAQSPRLPVSFLKKNLSFRQYGKPSPTHHRRSSTATWTLIAKVTKNRAQRYHSTQLWNLLYTYDWNQRVHSKQQSHYRNGRHPTRRKILY